MAEKNAKPIKPTKTMRDLAKDSGQSKKPGRVRQVRTKVRGPLSRIRTFGKLEYHPLKLPDNKAGKLLNKRVRLVPIFLKNAWAEIRQVTWPGRRETIRLSIAVFIFASVFGLIVAVLDVGLDKLFREFIIKV